MAQAAYDVVVLDLLMPGMSGMEFLGEARGRGALGSAKVMVTTGVLRRRAIEVLAVAAALHAQGAAAGRGVVRLHEGVAGRGAAGLLCARARPSAARSTSAAIGFLR